MSTKAAVERVFNFSAGPAVLPLPVLEEIQTDLLALPGCGASILEISHRSPDFLEILATAKQRLRQLLQIPETHEVLFLQGGSRLQFSMVPMNLLRGTDLAADYLVTGSWGRKAMEEARREGSVRALWEGKSTNYDRLPEAPLSIGSDSAYLHFTSNETIQGVQFRDDQQLSELTAGSSTPWVCDASSDFLSRPIDIAKYGLVYACAQKNAGPAGVTVVIIRQDLLERSQDTLPGYLNYREHAEQDSLYNTPPTFSIYVLSLVANWLLQDMGGLEGIASRNRAKASLLYELIDDNPGFYTPHAATDCRSQMNVTFRLPTEALEKQFVSEAKSLRLDGLKGHRSVGGIRASIYNAMPEEGVAALRDFMVAFRDQHRA